MLYNKRWDAKVEQKADPFALGSLIAWIEKQPSDMRYCYTDGGICLLSQYFSACGFKNVWLWGDCFYHGDTTIPLMDQPEAIQLGITTPIPRDFNDIARGVAGNMSTTFGAALKRARAALMAPN